MAPNPRVARAFRAMKTLGISEAKVKPVLKSLLKAYEKNWEPIEEENYRVLVDAIFENEEAEAAAKKNSASINETATKNSASNDRAQEEDEGACEEDGLERPLKRLRLKYQHGQSSQSNGNSSCDLDATSLKLPKDEPLELSEIPALQAEVYNGEMTLQIQHGSTSQSLDRNKLKQPFSPNNLIIHERFDPPNDACVDKSRSNSHRAEHHAISNSGDLKDRVKEIPPQVYYRGNTLDTGESSQAVLSEAQMTDSKMKISGSQALIIPKKEPFSDDSVQLAIPIAVGHPGTKNEGASPTGEQDNCAPMMSGTAAGKHASNGFNATPSDTGVGREHAKAPFEPSSALQIASSPSGEVKLFFSGPSLGSPDFDVPDIDTVVKLVEERCLRLYKLSDPNFSVMKLMQDTCECFLQLVSQKSEEQAQSSPKTDVSGIASSTDPSSSTELPFETLNGLLNVQDGADVALPVSILLPPPVDGVDGTQQLNKIGREISNGHVESEFL